VLHRFEGFLTSLPEVERPREILSFKQRFKWVVVVLLIYFLLANTMLYGLDEERAINYFGALQTIMASKFGTLMTLGIGPIVTGSIILQILVGGKLIDLDLSNPRDKAIYMGTQKLLSFGFTVFEAVVMVAMGALPAQGNLLEYQALIVAQLVAAGALVIYMDEVVSRWGFGSGIGLFIAAGVCEEIAWRGFNPFFSGGAPAGIVPKFLYTLFNGYPDFFSLVPLLGTLVVFAIVVYFESMRVEIPLTYGRFRGARGRYPIKFIYASNIPVIFASILMANVQLWAAMLQKVGYPVLGTIDQATGVATGVVRFFTFPRPIYTPDFDPVHAVVFTFLLITLSVLFSIFWVETAGMDAKTVARQLQQGGMKIPGFRGDIRIIERVLQRYIPAVTVLGGATVGALAALGDLTGALGGGTGVLLTVGILYRLYEEIAKHQIMEIHPMLRRVVGDLF